MTDQEINIAIAEACGWKWYRRPATGPWAKKPMRALYHPELHREFVATLQEADMTERECNWVFIQREGMIQNYCADLNAMHSALTAQGQGFNDKFSINLDSRAKRLGKHVHQLIARDWAEEFILQFKRG